MEYKKVGYVVLSKSKFLIKETNFIDDNRHFKVQTSFKNRAVN